MLYSQLPEELIGFYKKHIDYLTEHAIDVMKGGML